MRRCNSASTHPIPAFLISGDSIITLARGSFVAVVDNDIIRMHEVHVGRDLGTQIYVTSGLKDGDALVVNPTDVVQEGVHVVARTAPKGQEK